MRAINLPRRPHLLPMTTFIAGRRLSWSQWMKIPAFRRLKGHPKATAAGR